MTIQFPNKLGKESALCYRKIGIYKNGNFKIQKRDTDINHLLDGRNVVVVNENPLDPEI